MSEKIESEVVADDIRDLIRIKLKEDGRSFRWLSEKLGWGYSTMYGCIVEKRVKVTKDRLDAVNEALGTDYKLPETADA